VYIFKTIFIIIFLSISTTANAHGVSSKNQLNCLAKNVYFESRGESALGQIAVAWVTLNRVNSKRFPNTICGVVFQKSQFSWANGKGKHRIPRGAAWEKSKNIAAAVYGKKHKDPTFGATYFHGKSVNPRWNRKMKLTRVIGVHKFFYH